MLLSLVLHYHSKRLLFSQGLTVLEQYFRSDRIQERETFYTPTDTQFDSFPLHLTISSKEFFCLLPIWLWSLMRNTIYLHALNTSVVVNEISTYSIFRDSEDENKHDVDHLDQILKQLQDAVLLLPPEHPPIFPGVQACLLLFSPCS